MSAESLRQGKDVNWDLQNYHFYNAFAFLHDRLAVDVAPAQVQTFHNPLPDLPFFWLVGAGLPTHAIQVAMALPAAIGAFLVLRILATLFPAGMPERRWLFGAAAAIAFMGAGARSVISSTMNDWYCIALVMAAVALLVGEVAARPSVGRLAAAGCLAGAAMGLKLTYGPHALALGIAAMSFTTWRESLRRGATLAVFGIAGFLATYGFWGAILQREFANPFFPYFNAYFDSAWWEPISFRDTRYGPRDVLDAIVYPWRFIVDGRLADDAKFRDPRVAVLLVLALACAVKRVRHGDGGLFSRPEWRFVAVFAAAAYVGWLVAFGIYRYLIPVEILSGPLLVACALYLLPAGKARRIACVALALVMIAATMKQGWGRMPAGERYFEGSVPQIDPDSVVILEPQQPLAHVIPFLPASARFLAPESNFLAPGQENALARRAARIVADHSGAFYSLDRAESKEVERILAFYGLRRDPAACRAFASPLTKAPLRLCPVSRAAA